MAVNPAPRPKNRNLLIPILGQSVANFNVARTNFRTPCFPQSDSLRSSRLMQAALPFTFHLQGHACNSTYAECTYARRQGMHCQHMSHV